MVWGKRERACRNQAEVGAVTAEMQRVSERAGPAAPALPRSTRLGSVFWESAFLVAHLAQSGTVTCAGCSLAHCVGHLSQEAGH